MEVLERGEDLDDVGERLVDGERVVGASVGAHPLLEQLLERLTPDVLHDDVAGLVVGDEVVDLDDARVLDLGEEPLLGDGGGQRVLVAGVEQALEDDPAVGDVAVAREIDPAEPAVGERAGDEVLAGDEVARLELGGEAVCRAALGAEPLRSPGVAVDRPTNWRTAVGAVALVLGDGRVGLDGLGRVDGRRRWDGRDAGPETRSAGPRRADPAGRRGAGPDPARADRGGLDAVRGGSGRAGAGNPGRHRSRCPTCGSGAAGGATHIAVAVDDLAGAPGLGTPRAVDGERRLGRGARTSARRLRLRGRRLRGRGGDGGQLGRRHPADVAVAVDDRSRAPGLLACHEALLPPRDSGAACPSRSSQAR